MPNTYRNESRRRPPLEKYGTPGTQYPTANPYDVVITEEVTNRAQAFEPVLFGTPHPVVAAAVLCFQGSVKSNNTDKAPVRIYANPRLAQEPYNLINGDDEANDSNFPKYVRSYLLPRGYAKATKGEPLKALIGLTLVAGGSGYGAALANPAHGKIALGFTGGSGSGAAGWAEVAAGVIVAVVLTNTGSGYTSAPTVSVSGGSGASITALLQSSGALLVDEVETPAEDPYGGYFVRVTRTWETISGPQLTGKTMSGEANGAICTTSAQVLAVGEADPTPDFKMLAWTDAPVDANRKQRTTLVLPDDAFPELAYSDVDQATGIRINGTKQIVAAGASGSAYQEVQALDKWRSILISPSLDPGSLPAVVTTESVVRHSLPDIMTAFELVAVVNGGSGNIDIAMKYHLVEGYSGPCRAFITEKYLDAVAYAAYTAPGVTLFLPESTQLTAGYVNGDGARIYEFRTPRSLHGSFPTTISGTSASFDPTTIPATTPSGYNSNDQVVVDVQIEKWRMGVHRILETVVEIP